MTEEIIPKLVKTVAKELLDLKQKQGVLLGPTGAPEPSLAWELLESKGNDWLSKGWSLDVITTSQRGGLGIAKDIYQDKNREIDLGLFATAAYQDLRQGKINPSLGVGMHIRF